VFMVFILATQPGHPFVGRCIEYWRWFRSPLGKKRRGLRSSGPCDWDGLLIWVGRMADVGSNAGLIGFNGRRLEAQRKGDELPRNQLRCLCGNLYHSVDDISFWTCMKRRCWIDWSRDDDVAHMVLVQSWTWIWSIHELDWIGLGGMTVTAFLNQ